MCSIQMYYYLMLKLLKRCGTRIWNNYVAVGCKNVFTIDPCFGIRLLLFWFRQICRQYKWTSKQVCSRMALKWIKAATCVKLMEDVDYCSSNVNFVQGYLLLQWILSAIPKLPVFHPSVNHLAIFVPLKLQNIEHEASCFLWQLFTAECCHL